jgi:hypothetical protein
LTHTAEVPTGLWATLAELFRVPFLHEEMIWGIIPLYFSWIFNELTSAKATFPTAIQTGFALVWSGAHWAWQAVRDDPTRVVPFGARGVPAVNTGVTLLVLFLGALALWSGLRRKYPQGMKFLGHSRFSAYFMIAIFPVQAGYLAWTWERVWVIALFAVPVWLVLHFALKPLRR